MPANGWAGRPDGKRHRKEDSPATAGEKLKRCGKSAPARRQRRGLASPIWSKRKLGRHAVARRASGLRARGAWRHALEINGRPRQNPAYRPTRSLLLLQDSRPKPARIAREMTLMRYLARGSYAPFHATPGHKKEGPQRIAAPEVSHAVREYAYCLVLSLPSTTKSICASYQLR